MEGEIVVRIKPNGQTEIRVFANSPEERDTLFQKLESSLPAIELLESALQGEVPESK